MRARVVLHVGLMKSGTTHLQHTLFERREALADHGVQVLGRSFRHQFNAVLDTLHEGPGAPQWRGLVDEAMAHDGTSVISSEFLAPARPEAVAEVVGSFPGRDVEVVMTVRDLNRNLPAMWQETVQNGRTWTWAEYLAGAHARRPGGDDGVVAPDSLAFDAGRRFWRQQNAVRSARRWAAGVGADRVSVVTVPTPGAPRSLLWQRFSQVIGAPAELPGATRGGNESVGLASTLVLRRLNEVLDAEGIVFPEGQKQRKTYLAKQVMAARRGDEPSLGLDVLEWVRAQSARQVRGLQGLGVRLVGEWSDLDPVPVPGVQPEQVPDTEVAEAATVALARVVGDLVRRDLRPYDD